LEQVDLQLDAEVVPSIGTVQVGQAIKLFINLTTETSWGATRRYLLFRACHKSTTQEIHSSNSSFQRARTRLASKQVTCQFITTVITEGSFL
jgi:hypothetical protein